ncbi:hypothetical protein [Kribbella sp. NPDC051770]|uniref:hypothetical protein n=1 Tax=Kribbella sp. NPDC051770 TaxID=3155413 RepID=UPI00342D4B4D
MRVRTRAAAALAVVPLVLGVAACGGGEEPKAGDQPSTTTSTTSNTPASTPTPAPLKAPAVAHLNRATFLPAMNSALAKQTSYRTSGKMTAGGEVLMSITAVQQTKPLAMSMSMTGLAFQGKTAKIVLVGEKLYVSVPGAMPAGKYRKLDASDASMGQLSELASTGDPTRTFKAFGSALHQVKFVKSETLGGLKLDRYDLTVDTVAVLKAQKKKIPAGVPKTMIYSMWLDAGKMARRFSFDLQGVSMLMTMDPTSAPVTIKAPAKKNIVN